MKTDAELQQHVMDELKWEPTIHAAEIGVAVKDGVVTLSGSVDSYGKKWAADRAAKRVFGVKAVTEEIKVTLAGSYKRADKDIAQSATKVLDWNLWVPSDRVKVMVQDGRITLSGDVDWYYQKDHAEDAVRHLVGVLGVINMALAWGLGLLIASPWLLRNMRLYGDPLAWDFVRSTVDQRVGPFALRDIGWLLSGFHRTFWGRFSGAGRIDCRFGR